LDTTPEAGTVRGVERSDVENTPRDDPERSTDRLVDERAILRRLMDYCRGIDRLDEALVASVYHPDGTDDHGSFVGLGSDFARLVVRRLREHALSTTHFIGHPIIDFTSDFAADVEVQVLAWHRVRRHDGEWLEKFGGRYFDRFEKRDGEWRIAHRAVTHDWDALERVEPAFPSGTFRSSPRATA